MGEEGSSGKIIFSTIHTAQGQSINGCNHPNLNTGFWQALVVLVQDKPEVIL